MSIVISILAGVFGYLFLRGLYNHVQYLLLWRKVKKHLMSIEGSEEDKLEMIASLKAFIQDRDGVRLP